MKAPVYSDSGVRTVNIRPDGGVNLDGSPRQIADNEAAEMLNMWYYNGALRLRPGLRKKISGAYGPIRDIYPRDGRRYLIRRVTKAGAVIKERYGIYIVTRSAVLTYDGQTLERVPDGLSYSDGVWTPSYEEYDIADCTVTAGSDMMNTAEDSDGNTWKIEGGSIYIFGSGYYLSVHPEAMKWPFPVGEMHVGCECIIMRRQPYVPLILSGCLPAGGGTQQQARNFLTPAVKQSFTADSASTEYRLHDSGIDDSEVTVLYQDPALAATSYMVFGPGETTWSSAQISATLSRSQGTLTFSPAPNGTAGIKDNVTVKYSKTVYSDIPVTHCRFSQWFGDCDGKNGGGSRVFLSGSGGISNIVYFSAADEPSYFPDDGVITVGDQSDPVTGFGSQFGLLVIFKEHSVYSVDSQSAGTFSLRQVHVGDGCDMPGSISQVGNLLIFANTYSGVFALRSTQIKDERTAVHISRRVDKSLLPLGREILTAACSAGMAGRYFLFAGSAVYCADFNPLITSGGSGRGGDPPFYIWNIPVSPCGAFIFGGRLYVVSADDSALYAFDGENSDDGAFFPAKFLSKSFDFGLPDRLKRARPYLAAFVHSGAVTLLAGMDGSGTAVTLPAAAPACGGELRSEVLIGSPDGLCGTAAAYIERSDSTLAGYGIDSVTLSAAPAARAGRFTH
jgi:hypothetical protein